MTHPVDHLDDDLLSAVVDDQLTPNEKFQVQVHLGTCSACQERLDEFRSVATLLRRLPDVEPPRVFFVGPRPLVDPPNLVRLRRWYEVARASAASLAAVFVLLSLGTLYVDSRPTSIGTATLSTPKLASVPATAGQNTQPSATSAPASARAAAPAAAPATAGAATRPERQNPEPLDLQAAAATSQRPLPTVPAPQPTAVPPPAATAYTSVTADSAAPLRIAALVVGVLAAVTLLATLALRHRLQRSASHL